MVIAVYIKR